ncbi:MAG: aspartate kinase [SAR324 cluster bacterium]|nr:aspartate kinase [SAR324 cluster bacterium]
MDIIIQKFGGTSLGDGERLHNVADIIQQTLKSNRVIAVVSALSSSVKSKGTTSLLLQASEQAARGESFWRLIRTLRRQHLDALEHAVDDPELRAGLLRFIRVELERLQGFLKAIQVIRELSPRSQDILLATGERLSARMLAATLSSRGVRAEVVDLIDVVPEGTRAVDPRLFNRLQRLIAKRVLGGTGGVPIVTGFFGLMPGGLLSAVGRGYTDFTAALISAGLGRKAVKEMQVWKEVDGIFTADPRHVPAARVLERISPVEASELTYFGSEVLHPFTMERVVGARIPIRIKNTFNPEGAGTVIQSSTRKNQGPHITAVTAKRGITIFTVESNRMYNAHGFMARVFKVLEDYAVNVDLISTSEVSISCTVDRSAELERARGALEQLGQVTVIPKRAILAMVGEGMKYAVGTAGKMFSTLGANGINIEMISQGASEINISCVIKESDTETGLRAIHQVFVEEA